MDDAATSSGDTKRRTTAVVVVRSLQELPFAATAIGIRVHEGMAGAPRPPTKRSLR